jgi:hypothetical protein
MTKYDEVCNIINMKVLRLMENYQEPCCIFISKAFHDDFMKQFNYDVQKITGWQTPNGYVPVIIDEGYEDLYMPSKEEFETILAFEKAFLNG